MLVDSEEDEASTIRVFLSYSHNDREVAGEIKNRLEAHGLEVFLAHEDIEPNVEWEEEIFRRLKECDLFIPIFSHNFKESKWTDQETGIALGDDKMIISTSIDLAPYGFLGRKQALNLGESIPDSCDTIVEIIKDSALCHKLKDCLIESFVKSESFNAANERAKLLSGYKQFTARQIEKIVNGFLSNSQLSGAWTARRIFREMYPDYSELVRPEYKEKFEEIIRLNLLQCE